MAKYVNVEIQASTYESEDDCLAAAAADAATELDLEGWDLDARWGDENRDTIIVSVPAPGANDTAGWDRLRMFGGHPGR